MVAGECRFRTWEAGKPSDQWERTTGSVVPGAYASAALPTPHRELTRSLTTYYARARPPRAKILLILTVGYSSDPTTVEWLGRR